MEIKKLIHFVVGFCLCLLMSGQALAQSVKNIAIINSTQSSVETDLTNKVQSNIQELMRGKQQVNFKIINGKNSKQHIQKVLNGLQNDKSTNVIITTGILASNVLGKSRRYKKPSIAGFVINESLQGLPKALTGRSGKKNFTYVKEQFDIEADLRKFKSFVNYKNLAVLVDSSINTNQKNFKQIFRQGATNVDFVYVDSKNYAQKIAQLAGRADGVYVLPLASFNNLQLANLFEEINKNKLPSFAMLGKSYSKAGALGSYQAVDAIEIRARRIALNVLKIYDGFPIEGLLVNLPRVEKEFLLNNKTLNTLGLDLNLKAVKDADLIAEFDEASLDTQLDFNQAIQTALKNNLELQTLKSDLDLANAQISEAKRAFLPSLDITYTLTRVDEDFGKVQGALATQKLKGSATQVLYSDQAIGLYKARKLGVNANLEAIKRAEYQTIYDVLSGFVNHLNAKHQVQLQHENTRRTKQNLDIAKRKNITGYASKLDVYRLQSELNANQANLNKARAGYAQTKLVLKNLLNIPLENEVAFKTIQNPLGLLAINNASLYEKLQKKQTLQLFTKYLIAIAKERRPAILQYDYQLESLKQIADSEKRKWYVPTIAFSANGTKTIQRHQVSGPERTIQPNWDLSLSASLPLFDRQQKTNDLKNTIQIEKLKSQKQQLLGNINLAIRSDIETAIASYTQIELYRNSAKSAIQNFELVSNLYKHGQATITDLIGAQNHMLNAKLNVKNAEQQFFIDALKVERDSGFYYFIANDDDKNQFISQFEDFIANKGKREHKALTINFNDELNIFEKAARSLHEYVNQ